MANEKGFSHIGSISLIALILVISVVGLYFGYSVSNHAAVQANSVSLQSFSLNPSTSNLTGTIKVNSNSPLVRMSLYMNGTFLGSFDYSNYYGIMSTMMSGYPYVYSMIYSWYPSTMPIMNGFQFMSNRTYTVTMKATFEDGSIANSTTFIHP